MNWSEFVFSYLAFFVSHVIPIRPAIKKRLVALLGQVGFTLCYSLLSLAVLCWLIIAAGRAPYVELWEWEPWQNGVPIVGMAVAISITVLALFKPNPFSFGGHNDEKFLPTQPGLIRWMRHPLLVALMIWSFTHIVPNGNVAHLILFGTFAAFSWTGMKIIDRRKRRIFGDERWQEMLQPSNSGGFMPIPEAVVRLAVGALAYFSVLYAHAYIFGVSPLH